MSFLTLEGIHHTYFSKTSVTTAIDEVSLAVEEGEFVSFLGPSGCGKTTLLSIIAGLLMPTCGKAAINGKTVQRPDGEIGYMLQQDYLFPWKTIAENIFLGLKTMNKLNEDTKERSLRLLEDMGLGNVEQQYPDELSGGMRQRVALVRTLAVNPKLLLLDEPFSALDYQTKLKLEDLVLATLKEYNKTALLVTHDIGEAIAMSDRIYLLKGEPGAIARIFEVPAELRNKRPFLARQDERFSALFQTIWKELESLEQTS
ncbi:ABC transporter ATP-binding protein [Bacillus marinisedimentorum]|uniref:ABC transporter ATP-binding protein n=1 Tax=Bacillus marinisedimentorum TaxID=1821260 RepID=UPI000871C719|nr:ABC transporter ATP-binding protein [Bacillus marinisedimentorum]